MAALEGLLSVLSGVVVGVVLGVIGGGGSILALPLLLYVVGFAGDPHVAIGTTALAVAATALSGVAQHARKGHVRLRAGLAFALPGVVGALAGAWLGLGTPARSLLLLFAIMMLVVAWRMWPRAGEVAPAAKPHPVVLALAGLGVGFLAGFFGIGGGFLVVPALVWAARLDMRDAVGTSLVVVAAFGLATAARYALAGSIDLGVAALFAAGGLAGSSVGARMSHGMPKDALKKALAVALVVVAAAMVALNA